MTYEDMRQKNPYAVPQANPNFVEEVFAPPAGFHGLNLGLFNIGVTDSGSFTAGVNIPGIVRVQPRVGADTGLGLGVGLKNVVGPELDATALRFDRDGVHSGIRERSTLFGVAGQSFGAGADVGNYTGVGADGQAYAAGVDGGAGGHAWVDRYGAHARAYQGTNAFGLAGENVAARADLGARTGAGTRADAHVGPITARGGSHAYLDQNGLDAAAGGRVDVANVAGVHGGGRLALNNYNSEVRAGGGAYVGAAGFNTGAGVWSDGNTTIRPDAYVSGHYYGHRGTAELNPPRYAPPGNPASTPEAVSQFSNRARQDVVNHSVYTVQPGQNTYRDVAAAIAPGADEQYLRQSERYLAYINHNHQLRPGEQIATLKAEHVDLRVRQITAQHFGWQMPTT
jgi:hypothetical protein